MGAATLSALEMVSFQIPLFTPQALLVPKKTSIALHSVRAIYLQQRRKSRRKRKEGETTSESSDRKIKREVGGRRRFFSGSKKKVPTLIFLPLLRHPMILHIGTTARIEHPQHSNLFRNLFPPISADALFSPFPSPFLSMGLLSSPPIRSGYHFPISWHTSKKTVREREIPFHPLIPQA